MVIHHHRHLLAPPALQQIGYRPYLKQYEREINMQCLLLTLQESCAIAKMTVRCALYKWIEWAVAEIWPFEIIQDKGN